MAAPVGILAMAALVEALVTAAQVSAVAHEIGSVTRVPLPLRVVVVAAAGRARTAANWLPHLSVPLPFEDAFDA